MNTELFTDARGTQIEVHERSQSCIDYGCCVHSPSLHPLRNAPLIWSTAGPLDIKPSHMQRICKHGVWHPDYDSQEYLRRCGEEQLASLLWMHTCCGCCIGTTFIAEAS